MKMAFKGTLKEFKVPDILQLISLQRKTGILTFTSSDGFITLIFQTGMIVGVDSFPKKLEMRVGSVLVKQDFISEEMLQRALDIQKRTNQKIGEILVGMGLIGSDTINESLKTQAVEIVLSLFKWKRGEYNFKIMEQLEEGMKIIEPTPTDNLIMEGVQMLDEWPQIKQVIPEETMVFEPAPVDSKKIEIVGEYEEVPEEPGEKTYLTENETNLLKYVNGKNTVQELVELGFFTEYKVYKGLYNLIRKGIIQARSKTEIPESREDKIQDQKQKMNLQKLGLLFNLILFVLIIIFIVRFFNPLSPFKTENILLKTDFYQQVLPESHENTPTDRRQE
jgi:hypothetical protein